MRDSHSQSCSIDHEGNEAVELLQQSHKASPSSIRSSSTNKFEQRKGLATITTTLFRSVGLQVVNVFGPWKIGSERRKVAIRQDRFTALLRCAVHIIPLVACLILILFNICTIVISYNSGYAILQFVAKIHEVLMQASIAAILLSYIRSEALQHGGTPFGSLFAGVQVSQISYLWSPELLGTLTATCLESQRKIRLAFMIVLSCLLAASVGPSSAILMLPRDVHIPMASVAVSIAPIVKDSLFPFQLNSSNNGTR
jgi:hypothetical protein